jgi:methionyl-tRNA formyltransferase
MRVIYAASPAIAVPALEVLCKIKGIELAGVLTNPDTPKGRSCTPQPTEISEAAQKLLYSKEIPVLKPAKLDADAREQISLLKPDLLLSFAYGHIFGPKFLALFPMGGINIHPSLLPKYRGPSPVQAAILNRDAETGISIQTIAAEMDQGSILASKKLQLTGKETSDSLGKIIAAEAAVMISGVLEKITEQPDFINRGLAQNHSEASYCSLISRDDGIIDWNKNVLEIDAAIRAYNPWPLCRTIHNGRELYILKAGVYTGENAPEGAIGTVLGIDKQYGILIQTGEGILAVTDLQYQAKKALFWRDFLNGVRDFSGSLLG